MGWDTCQSTTFYFCVLPEMVSFPKIIFWKFWQVQGSAFRRSLFLIQSWARRNVKNMFGISFRVTVSSILFLGFHSCIPALVSFFWRKNIANPFQVLQVAKTRHPSCHGSSGTSQGLPRFLKCTQNTEGAPQKWLLILRQSLFVAYF